MKKDRLVLAIETSFKKGSLSIMRGATEIGSWTGNEETSRSEDLVSGIEYLLKVNDLSQRNVDLIVVSRGPGSFTGLRVGIAVGQGLALALDCPLMGIPTLETMAFYGINSVENVHKKIIVSLVSAGRDQVYWQKFQVVEGLPQALTQIEITPLIDFTGENFSREETLLVLDKNIPNTIFPPTGFNLRSAGSGFEMAAGAAKFTGWYAAVWLNKSGQKGKLSETAPIYVRNI